jgi:hypothetical protein
MPIISSPTVQNSAALLDQQGLNQPLAPENGIDLNKTYDDLVKSMSEQGQILTAGKIPDDVQGMVMRAAAEKGLQGGQGAGSQSARNLTARDLGLTSIDLISRGVEISKVAAQLAEAKVEFRKTYGLAVQEHLENVRKGDMTVAQINEDARQFSAKATLAVNQMISDIAQFGMNMQFQYAVTKQEGVPVPAASTTDIRNMILDLKKLVL